jgi:hypothetical protein
MTARRGATRWSPGPARSRRAESTPARPPRRRSMR